MQITDNPLVFPYCVPALQQCMSVYCMHTCVYDSARAKGVDDQGSAD